LFPEQLSRALLPPGCVIATATWLDTQVTSRQRRLDRAIDVRIADGDRRVLHNEWQLRMESDVPFRVFEYHTLLVFSLMDELAAAKSAAAKVGVTLPEGAMKLPRVESTVVLLSGREEAWPEKGDFRTSPDDGPYAGVGFRIEPVYQRTLAEIAARGSLLWLIFAPLAVDATPEGMAKVVEDLRREASPREFEELSVALAVMADADKRRRGLREVIVSLLPEEIVMESWVFKQGIEKGIEKGVQKGSRQELTKIFERKLRRPLADQEQATLVQRLDTLGADRLRDVVLDLPAEALEAWIDDLDAK
jgi:hypothetical protein